MKLPGESELEALDFDGVAANFRMIMTLEPPRVAAYRAALRALERGLARSPKTARLHALRGKALSNLSRFDEARDSLKRALALEPGDARARAWLGEVYLLENRIQFALVELNRALKENPEAAWARFYRAAALYVAGRVADAREDLRHVLGSRLAAAGAAKAFLGLIESQAGRHSEALALIDSPQRAGPADAWIYVLRAAVNRASGNREAALVDLNSALALRPAGWLYLERALLYEQANDTGRALADVSQALKRDGPSDSVLLRRGRLRAARKELDLAAADLAGALKLGCGADARAFAMQLGEAYLSTGRRKEALKVLTLAVARFPGDGEVLFSLAQAENKTASFARAATALRTVLVYGGDARQWLALAKSEACRSRFGEAVRAATRAQKLAPSDAEIQRFLKSAMQAKRSGVAAARLLSGLFGLQAPSSEEAMGLLQQGRLKEAAAAAAASSDLRVHQALGEAYERAGHQDAAMLSYRRAVELGPTRLTPYFHLARLLLIDDDGPGAARALQGARRQAETGQDVGVEIMLDRFQLALCLLDNVGAARLGEKIIDQTRSFEHLESLSVPIRPGFDGAAISPAMRRYTERASAAAAAYARRHPKSPWAAYIVNLWQPGLADERTCRRISELPASRYGWMLGRVGYSLLYRGEFKEAILPLTLARDFSQPRDWRCQCFIAEARILNGDLEGALLAFHELDSWPEAPRGEVLAWKAEILLWGGRYAEALAILEDLPLQETSPYALCWKGAALCQLGRYAPALAALDAALARYPNDREARVWRAETLLRGGRTRAALKAADHALDLGGGGADYAHAVRGLVRAAAGDTKGLRADFHDVARPLLDAATRHLGLTDVSPGSEAPVLEAVLKMSRGIRRGDIPYPVWGV